MNDESSTPAGLRDTPQLYADGDPLQWVDPQILDALLARCGDSVLDLGCGAGGYSRRLADAGRRVVALDIHPQYVERARSLGVDARRFDGVSIPLEDASVDTVVMVEVLEHVQDPDQLLAEVRRVTRGDLVLTVPNNTQRLNDMVVWSHMLDVDHRNFFSVESLRVCLSRRFGHVEIQQIAPADLALAEDLLPKALLRLYRFARRRGWAPDRFHFRLLAEARPSPFPDPKTP